MQTSNLSPKSKPPYLVGILCLIPLIGAIVGAVLLILGLTKYKDKWLSIIGVVGIMFTVLIYSWLFYAMKHSPLVQQGFREISQMQLNSLIKNIEFYKLQHGSYPDSLQLLTNDDPFAPVTDAIQLNQRRANLYYNYEKIGDQYLLFSSGQDGIPNTEDDLHPDISLSDSSNIGLIEQLNFNE
ncbi:MAG: YgaP family membrane protein [Chitinophagaceae bacterium]